jgi:hypothetical protein
MAVEAVISTELQSHGESVLCFLRNSSFLSPSKQAFMSVMVNQPPKWCMQAALWTNRLLHPREREPWTCQRVLFKQKQCDVFVKYKMKLFPKYSINMKIPDDLISR